MAMNSITPSAFQALLLKAKQLAGVRKAADEEAAIATIEEDFVEQKPHEVDLNNVDITPDSLKTEVGRNAAVEILGEVVSGGMNKSAAGQSHTVRQKKVHTTGVAADVTLNAKQKLFIETALSGEDICLVGAAGTGKTTVVGKFVNALVDNGEIPELGSETKWLRPSVPGVLITSFTRKAVNNIRRAIPDRLKPHVLTMHKVLEFQPVFYEAFDEKTGKIKKTMRFEPQRNALNPLPSSLLLVTYEESSMIGTDLYQLMSDAMPHNPQEIFIGDIRQLPPIFGPAILGFKMSLLTVVELDEVYRQALLSPIIRLAHSILSGDSSKFSLEGKYTAKEPHPHLVDKTTGKPKIVERIHIPNLEKFDESGEHGSVRIQIWQKRLPTETALHATIQQFIAWERSGYYKPEEDIILCPFNISYGTIELNRGIQNYLATKRNAVVHEVIAGFDKHYLAIGDRVLYDKEDAIITDIRRNLTYLGKSPQPASKYLDRWGAYQEELTEEQILAAEVEESSLAADAMDKFMENFGDDEEKVNVASHAIDIVFSYSDEKLTLSSAGEVNSLLGGNAITIHKMQGSEAETIFVTLHHSHAAMIQNELLYTAVSRARTKLHILCEMDTLFKGVKSQKVRGVTLADKIEFFKGKVEYKEMQFLMDMLKRKRKEKEARLEETRKRELQQQYTEQEAAIHDTTEPDDSYTVDYTMLSPPINDNDRSELLEVQEEREVAPSEAKQPELLKQQGSPVVEPPERALTMQEKLLLLRNKARG